MEKFFGYLGPIMMAAVVVVLGLGLFNMLRGGSGSRSQSLMRWRVGLQFVAVILLMLTLYFTSR
ncbi:MAG TPA: twin transmembrane helix small protein [Parvibaculum sp.]|jgi:hypothetical protein